MRIGLPKREEITPDTPLRLAVAAAVAFPDGSMTASGLRRESLRGRLVVERIAGKLFTSLIEIERMRERCRVKVEVPDSGSGQPVVTMDGSSPMPFGSSSTAAGTSPRDALSTKLAKRKSA
jgi:hypothetical protein